MWLLRVVSEWLDVDLVFFAHRQVQCQFKSTGIDLVWVGKDEWTRGDLILPSWLLHQTVGRHV